MKLQIVGGGLAGLVAAVEAASQGAEVRLYEAHETLGGRARTSAEPYIAHEGPHVVYADGPMWSWLGRLQLRPPSAPVPARAMARFWFRRDGKLTRWPGNGLPRVVLHRRPAPVEESFATWASRRFGAETARLAASASGVATYHHDPGSLSARFVHDRLRRAFSVPPQATYITGGWSRLVDVLASEARRRGVVIETGHRVTELPSGGPVLVATSLAAARTLLGDDSLQQPSGAAALVDVSVRADRRDAFLVSDLDANGWLERYTAPDPSLAPSGESLVQAQVPLAPDDDTAVGIARVEALLDLGVPGWRERVTWRRDAIARGRTGAVDLPGRTWQDRPALDRGGDVYLAGDQVAAPGLLSEVSFNSAITATHLALGTARQASHAGGAGLVQEH